MRKVIHLEENKTIILSYKEIDGDLDMDQITSIDHSNLYGEIVTCSVLLNKIGLIKSEAESLYEEAKLDCDIHEASLKKKYRKEASLNGGKVKFQDESLKLTEAGLSELILLDSDFIEIKKELINMRRDLAYIESLYWSIQSKDNKLKNIVPKVTPKEFFDELVEGVLNTFTIKKFKEWK